VAHWTALRRQCTSRVRVRSCWSGEEPACLLVLVVAEEPLKVRFRLEF
jgi:hypothetical protein